VITGAHSIIYSRRPEADRRFLRDVLRLPHVDAGEGWLIFGLPPAEVAVHPSRKNGVHELWLICPDVRAFVAAMRRRRVRCGPVVSRPYGHMTHVRLPGGGQLGVYEPTHPRPAAPRKRSAGGRRRAPRREVRRRP